MYAATAAKTSDLTDKWCGHYFVIFATHLDLQMLVRLVAFG